MTPSEVEVWVLETAPRAMAYARSLLRHEHDAEDIIQECYCRLLNRASIYDLKRDGLKLLLTAITNACINLRTRRKPLFRLVKPDDSQANEEPPDRQQPTAVENLEHQELSQRVAVALQQLPPQQRAAIELKALDYSQQEIAEILGTTPGNVGVLIHRGRQTLAQLLQLDLGEPTG